jgi:hypothetical protein
MTNIFDQFDNVTTSTKSKDTLPQSTGNIFDQFDKDSSKITDKRLTTTDLLTDRAWINASKQVYKNQTGKEWVGPDNKAAEWGIGNTADFEYDITKTVGVAAKSKNFDLATANAWDTLLTKYGQLGVTWGGTGRALRYMATDPTFLPSMVVGFGAGKIAAMAGAKGAKVAAKFAIKEAIKKARKEALEEATKQKLKGTVKKEFVASAINQAKKNVAKNVGLVVGTEAGIYGGVGDYAYQAANVNLNRQDDINIGQTLLMTGLTATGGGLLGWGLPSLARLASKTKTRNNLKPFDEIFNPKEEARIAKIQSKEKGPVSSATKAATIIAREVVKRNPNARVLSYGSGAVDKKTGKIKEVVELQKSGAKVDAYDLEPNMVDLKTKSYKPQYNPNALYEKYDVINASNIFKNIGRKNPENTASRIIDQIANSLDNNGVAVLNPVSKGKINKKVLQNILEEKFEKVEWGKGSFKVSKPIQRVTTDLTEEGIKKTGKNKTLLFIKKNFYSDAGAGETIAHGRRLQRNIGKVTARKVKVGLSRLENALKKNFGSLDNVNPRVMSQLVAGLEGRSWKLEGIGKETVEAITEMRRALDDAADALVDSGAVKDKSKLKVKIQKSKGSAEDPTSLRAYVNTSYGLFDDPNFKVTPEAREAGREYFKTFFKNSKGKENIAYRNAKLVESDPKKTLNSAQASVIEKYEGQDGIVEGLINRLTQKEGDDYVSQLASVLNNTRGVAGSKAIKILQQKKNIDPVIAGLFGQTTDVGSKFSNTLTKLNNIRANYEYSKALRQAAKEGSEIVRETPSPRGQYAVPVRDLISDPNIEGLDRPLKNLWTTSEFADIIEQSTELAAPVQGNYKYFLLGKAATQIAKTAYSVGSIARNFVGAGMQALGNGYINPRLLAEATTAFRALQSMPPARARAEIERLTLLGVLDSDVKAQAMIELSKDIDSNFFLKGLKKHAPQLGVVNRKVLDVYQSADNYWKWFAYLNEKGRYRQVLIDKGIDPDKVVRSFTTEGVQQNITELDEFAAKMVRENMHNYGETSRAVKYARRAPLADFIAFKTEMMRTSKNIVKNGIKDLREGGAMMARGERNLDGSRKGAAQVKAGMIRMGGATGAVVGTGAAASATADYFGLNELVAGTPFTKKEALEEFDPDFNKGSEWLYLSDMKDGKGLRINMSYTDPWAIFKQPIRAATRAFQIGDNPDIAFDNAFNQVVTDFKDAVGPSILTSAILDIAYNTDKFGRPVTKDQGMTQDNINRVLRFWEAFEPGTMRNVRKIIESGTRGGMTTSGFERNIYRELGALTGVTVEKYDINKSLPFKIMGAARDLNSSDSEYKKAFRNYRGENPETFINLYVEAQDKKFRAAQDMWKTVQAAKATGMSDGDIYDAMTQGGLFPKSFSKQFIRTLIRDGSFIPDKPENTTLRKWEYLIKKKNKEAAAGMTPVRDTLWDLYGGYVNKSLTTYEQEVEEQKSINESTGNIFDQFD